MRTRKYFIHTYYWFCVFFGNYKNFNGPLFWLGVFFSVNLFLLIGFTTPVAGALVRYKCIALPFLLISAFSLLDLQKIKEFLSSKIFLLTELLYICFYKKKMALKIFRKIYRKAALQSYVSDASNSQSLNKVLTVKDLTFLVLLQLLARAVLAVWALLVTVVGRV